MEALLYSDWLTHVSRTSACRACASAQLAGCELVNAIGAWLRAWLRASGREAKHTLDF